MRNILFILVAFSLLSCSENSNDIVGNEIISIKDTLMVESPVIQDSDSVFDKVNDLIKSTEHANKKVSEIKVMKKENTSLKKELVETKNELKQANEQIKRLDSTIKTTERKGVIRRMIDNIKGDSVDKDSTNNK